MSMHIVHIEYHPTGFTVLTTYREIADMADVGIRAGENVGADVREDPVQVNTVRNVLPSEDDGTFTTDHEAVEQFACVLESDAFGEAAGTEPTILALVLARGLRGLAPEHETLHLRSSEEDLPRRLGGWTTDTTDGGQTADAFPRAGKRSRLRLGRPFPVGRLPARGKH